MMDDEVDRRPQFFRYHSPLAFVNADLQIPECLRRGFLYLIARMLRCEAFGVLFMRKIVLVGVGDALLAERQ